MNYHLHSTSGRSALCRRAFLAHSAAIAAGVALGESATAQQRPPMADSELEKSVAKVNAPAGLRLGFSLYGMKSLEPAAAVKQLREIGYESTELPLMTGWPAESETFSLEKARELKAVLEDQSMHLASLMENLSLVVSDDQQTAQLERLKRAAEIACEFSPEFPTPVETVVGGTPMRWELDRQAMVDRLKQWAEVAAEFRVPIAIKAHIGSAMHRPIDVLWMIAKTNSPWIKAVYDYSHFQLQGLSIRESLTDLLPHLAMVHVKDGKRLENGKPQFLLPGDGMIGYGDLLEHLAHGKFRGDVVVEVSGQLSQLKDYDALEAARKSFAVLKIARDSLARE